MEEIILQGILDGKEKRAREQKDILRRYNNTLISFTLNIPGPNKRGLEYKKVFERGIREIKDMLYKHNLKIVHTKIDDNVAGYIFFCSVIGKDTVIKALMIQLENASNIGRLFDIDVFNKKGELLSRHDFKIVKRKCLICEKDAVTCARNRTHSIEELLPVIDNIINEELEKEMLVWS
ncbi:MAG: citrate lyase holo-[acyl-carrier protein] synthase [Sarcina sp.]